MEDWKSIKSAPRDGTVVLLYAEAWDMSWGTVQTGFFDPAGSGEWVTGEGSAPDNNPDFDPEAEVDEDVDYGDDSLDWEANTGPTHWMHLPKPPAS